MQSPAALIYIWPAVGVHLAFSTPHPSECVTIINNNEGTLRQRCCATDRLAFTRPTLDDHNAYTHEDMTQFPLCELHHDDYHASLSYIRCGRGGRYQEACETLRIGSYPAVLPVEERGVKTPS